jgi:Trypsin-co-occurring domain 2
MGLADFLSDLRAELAEASKRAEQESLKLGVEEVEVELDVAVTLAKRGEATARRRPSSGSSPPLKGV